MLRSTRCGILISNVEVNPPRCLAVKPRNLTSFEVVFKKIKGTIKNVNLFLVPNPCDRTRLNAYGYNQQTGGCFSKHHNS